MTVRPYYPIKVSRRRLSISTRGRDAILTVALWWIYFLFMKDFFIFLSDMGRWIWNGFADTDKYASFRILPTLLSYGEVTAAFAVVYIVWARYNQYRFRGKCRRRNMGPVKPEELAEFYGLNAQVVRQWQKSKTLILQFDEEEQVAQH
jgi:poly-beta-1,6-N-acetyl-D-glucosamine biosynthesis protein PgaD